LSSTLCHNIHFAAIQKGAVNFIMAGLVSSNCVRDTAACQRSISSKYTKS